MPITIQTASDGPPKRRLIELAFGEIGSAGYEFGRTAEEVADALMRLNAMMYEWPWKQLNYQQPAYGLGSLDDYSGIPFEAMNGVAAQLALRIAPVMGAPLSAESKAALGMAVSRIYAMTATIKSMPHDRHTPRGMGSEHALGIGFASPFIDDLCDGDGDSDDVGAVVVASINGLVMTVTSVISGTVQVNQLLSGTLVAANSSISGLGTGSGGLGTYTVSVSQTVPSTTITCASPC